MQPMCLYTSHTYLDRQNLYSEPCDFDLEFCVYLHVSTFFLYAHLMSRGTKLRMYTCKDPLHFVTWLAIGSVRPSSSNFPSLNVNPLVLQARSRLSTNTDRGMVFFFFFFSLFRSTSCYGCIVALALYHSVSPRLSLSLPPT